MAVTQAPTAAKKPPAKKAPAKKAPAKPQTPAQKKAAAAKKAAEKEMDYGYAKAFLQAHPDVWQKVKAAVKGGWTAQRLEAEIKTTKWWTTRTDNQRKSDLLSKENPKEWQRQREAKAAEVKQAAAGMGLSLSDSDIVKFADSFLINGSSNGEMQSALAQKFTMPADDAAVTGQAGITVDALNSIATAYGVTLDDSTAQNYVRQILAGNQTPEGLTDVFREQAKTLYPSIADFLDKNPGATTQDYASPYFQIAAKELGLPTTEMDLSDSKWNKVLSSGATGLAMTADEWTRTLRSDQQYGWDKTVNARDQAAQMATALQRTFGAAG